MSSFIKRSKQITQNQLQMFDIIPKLFYSSYEKIFCHSFDTLQAFIFYGKDILSSTPKAMKTIIEMGITSMNMLEGKDIVYKEADNCEGVLVLQSLILSCGKSFDNEMWMVIMNSLSKRIENPVPKTNFLKAKYFSYNLVCWEPLV